jgi:hypothetical protein
MVITNRTTALIAAFLALTPAAVSSRTDDTIIAPGAARNVEGNSDNLYPFSGDPIRYQQVVAASEFAGGPRWITRIALRPDANSGRAFEETLSHVEIRLSTSARAPAALSKTFAENVGDDETLVYSGALPLASAFSGPEGGPKDFDILITFQTPFWYDPSAGHLLLDVRNVSGGRTTQYDAQDAPDSTARVWSDDVNAATARNDDPFPSVGLVLKFISDY